MTSDNPIVFVVDDDYRVREALSSLIASVGLRVTAYGSAAEFLAKGDRGAVCMIVDQHMPQMSGLELIARLDGTAPRRNIMLITGSLSPAISERAAALGVALVMEKPPGSNELLDFVNACKAARQGTIAAHL